MTEFIIIFGSALIDSNFYNKMKLYFIRHTAVDVPPGTCYGQTDVPLKSDYIMDGLILRAKIALIPKLEKVYTSPSGRCSLLAQFCGFENAITDKRLMEFNFGDWEMQNWEDVDLSIWENDWINVPAPHGESFRIMYQRVSSFLDELKKNEDKSVLIFTHAGVINCARVYFNELEMQDAFDNTPKYGEIVYFNLDDSNYEEKT